VNGLLNLGKELNLSPNHLADVVHASDSFQGQEADIVILDTTVGTYAGEAALVTLGIS
jgi:hypothetical protein